MITRFDEVMNDVIEDDETVPVDEVDGGGVSSEEEADAGAGEDGEAEDETGDPVTKHETGDPVTKHQVFLVHPTQEGTRLAKLSPDNTIVTR